MEVPQGIDFAGFCAFLGPQSLTNRRHSIHTPWVLNEGGWGAEGAETPVPGRGSLRLPFELAKQDEVGGSAREGSSASDAGWVGDGDEETLPDVSAIFLLLLGARSLRLLRAVFALNKPGEKPFRTHSELLTSQEIAHTLLELGELSGLSRR